MKERLKEIKEASILFIGVILALSFLLFPVGAIYIGNQYIPPMLASMGVDPSGGLAIFIYVMLTLLMIYLMMMFVVLIF